MSIAFEELGLAHLINAEAEKLQGAIGTLVDKNGQPVNPLIQAESLAELLEANREVEKVLRTIIKKEMLLQFKFENILEFLSTTTSTTTSTSTSTTINIPLQQLLHLLQLLQHPLQQQVHVVVLTSYYNYINISAINITTTNCSRLHQHHSYKYNIYNFYYNM